MKQGELQEQKHKHDYLICRCLFLLLLSVQVKIKALYYILCLLQFIISLYVYNLHLKFTCAKAKTFAPVSPLSFK